MNQSEQQANVIAHGVAAGVKVALEDNRSKWIRFAVIVIILSVVTGEVADYFKFGFDSTDGDYRSNLSLHIDNMTGCHYIGGPNGGLTPRLDRDGSHICR